MTGHQGVTDEAIPSSPVMDVSIIIISWNTQDLLRDALRSVHRHAPACRWEIIVVDNDSADGSPDMVEREFPTVRLVRNRSNRGFAAANNQAMAIASGRYMLLLNSDARPLDDVMQQSIMYLDNHEDVAVLGSRVVNPDHSLQLTCFRFPTRLSMLITMLGLHHLPWPPLVGWYQMRDWARDDIRDVEVVTGCYMVVRRKAIEEVGAFDESFFFYGEETDWCLRFRRAGWAVRFAPVGNILHHGSASAGQLDGARGALLADALIRLQAKHFGAIAALTARVLLAGFGLSRSILFVAGRRIPGLSRYVRRWNHCASVMNQAFRRSPIRPAQGTAVQAEDTADIRRAA